MARITSSAILLLPALMAASILAATPSKKPQRPVHTYSIVARDPVTGDLGVAVQSHWFSVGSIVTWARAGVGAVATQSFVQPGYGPRGLELMVSGLSAPQALQALLTVDDSAAVRQVAMVDAAGRVAAHTGDKCIRYAGHHTGDGYSVQANMMLTDRVVPAMARAFEAAEGTLADRLLTALEAAEAAGGDIRGRQSAAMLIVRGQPTGRVWEDTLVSLRVEDHPEPLPELRRLLTVQRAYEAMNAGDVAIEHGDAAAAMRHYSAAAALLPHSLEVRYWQGITLATSGQLEQALPILREVFAADIHWVELTRRLIEVDIIPNTDEGQRLLQRILAAAPEQE
ncbi:MAG: DUF1028 domain-containing protein [Acidobacteria bacterium]|nr:DUF1028 domain-containing protein [Acidobacteriota bacterium]